jgi:hypothetical protein
VRTYTDAKGDVFTLPDDKKGKIVVNVMGALSLFHLGMENDQVAAIFDHWMVRGSNIDINDPTQEHDSFFALDPDKEDIEFLEKAVNLSPTGKCVDNSGGCWRDIDAEAFASLNGDYDFIVLFLNANGGATGLQQDFEEDKDKVIYIDYVYDHNQGCFGTGTDQDRVVNEEGCYSLSAIDSVKEMEEFAAFLGVQPTEKVLEDKRAMCEVAANFVEHSKMLHEKGIYAYAASFRPFNGITISWFGPTFMPWTKTLEELGFPLVHPPSITRVANNPGDGEMVQLTTEQWFVNCNTYPDCDDWTGAHPVDLWLLDSRTYAFIYGDLEGSKDTFPDRAFEKEQIAYWQFNDGAISYKNIAAYLNDIIKQTSNVERVHDTTLTCLDVDVTSWKYSNKANGGIAGIVDDPFASTFACHGNFKSLYLECPTEAEFLAFESEEEPPESPQELPDEPSETPVMTVSGGVRRAAMTTVLALQMAAVAWVFAN